MSLPTITKISRRTSRQSADEVSSIAAPSLNTEFDLSYSHITDSRISHRQQGRQSREESPVVHVHDSIDIRPISPHTVQESCNEDISGVNLIPTQRASRLQLSDLRGSQALDEHVPFSHYPFLQLGRLSTVDQGEFRFLDFIGSLHVPIRSVLSEFLKEFFLHVHPSLPILDESTFWAVYHHTGSEDDSSRRISLFLLQAMIFASCSVRCYYHDASLLSVDRFLTSQ